MMLGLLLSLPGCLHSRRSWLRHKRLIHFAQLLHLTQINSFSVIYFSFLLPSLLTYSTPFPFILFFFLILGGAVYTAEPPSAARAVGVFNVSFLLFKWAPLPIWKEGKNVGILPSLLALYCTAFYGVEWKTLWQHSLISLWPTCLWRGLL